LDLHKAAAGPGRSEHRNVDILIPLARQRESPAGPNVPCERRTGPAAASRHLSPAPAPVLYHRKTGESTRRYLKARDRPRRLCPGNGFERALRATAGSVRSEHWKRTPLSLARSAKAPSPLELTCERRTGPAEPLRGTDPQRQPWHSATAKQVRAPGCMRRSFRTLRLCAIPGVSPRPGMRCPVGALRTPHHPQSPNRLHASGAITPTHLFNDNYFPHRRQ